MGLPKTKTATTLRNDLYESLKEASEGKTQIITHKQGEPVVLISQERFNKLLDEKEALKKMSIGLAQIKEGKGTSHKTAIASLKKMSKKWIKIIGMNWFKILPWIFQKGIGLRG